MSSTPLGTRSLKLLIDGNEYNADINNCTLEVGDADSDFTSFADANAGGAKKFSLKFTATQDPADPDSIWTKVWEDSGSEVPAVVNPYGGTELSATNPALSGTLIVAWPDGTLLGGDADASTTAKFTMDLEWDFKAKPTLVKTGTYITV